MRKEILLPILLLILSQGCDKEESSSSPVATAPQARTNEPQERPKFDVQLSDASLSRAREMAKVLEEHRALLGDQESDPQNLRPLLYLAANSEDSFVVAQALIKLGESPPSILSEEFLQEAKPVLLYWLEFGDPRVVASGLKLAHRYLAEPPDPEVVATANAILADGSSSVLAGHAAAALRPVKFRQLSEGARAAIGAILTAEATQPVTVAQVIDLVIATKGAPAYKEAIAKHLSSEEASVRGLAAKALLLSGHPEAVDRVKGLLSDEAPLVRAMAARALGRIEQKSLVDALAPLVKDDAETRVETLTGTGPEGSQSRYQHLMPIETSVSVSAMLAIEELSDGGLVLQPFVPTRADEIVPKNRAKTLAWLGSN